MIRLHCHGAARGLLPDPVDFDAMTPAEAIGAACVQAPALAACLRQATWTVQVDRHLVDDAQLLAMQAPGAEVHLRPATEGAGLEVPTLLALFAVSAVSSIILSSVLAPEVSDYDDREAEGRRSYLFNAPVNVAAQGGVVPLIFGRMRVGSTLVSAGITSERQT